MHCYLSFCTTSHARRLIFGLDSLEMTESDKIRGRSFKGDYSVSAYWDELALGREEREFDKSSNECDNVALFLETTTPADPWFLATLLAERGPNFELYRCMSPGSDCDALACLWDEVPARTGEVK